MSDHSNAAVDTDRALRAALGTIPLQPHHYGPWWGTDAGQDLYQVIADRVAIPLARKISAIHGSRYETSDIANTAVELLRHTFTVKALSRADNPWGYLYTVLQNEMQKQLGQQTDPIDRFERMTGPAVEDDAAYTPLAAAAELTALTLAPHTPAALREALPEAVLYFAERGHSRLSHLYTDSSQDNELLRLGLNRGQILAIANAVLGTRHTGGVTSLLAGFIIDRDWEPGQSPAHRGALIKYQTRMIRESLRHPTVEAS